MRTIAGAILILAACVLFGATVPGVGRDQNLYAANVLGGILGIFGLILLIVGLAARDGHDPQK